MERRKSKFHICGTLTFFFPCVPTGDRGGEYKIATTIYFSLKSGYAQESFYSIQAGSLIYQGMRINLIFKDQVKISCYNIILILSLILLVISIVILTVGIRKKINAMKIIGIILCVISILGLGISITRDDPSN